MTKKLAILFLMVAGAAFARGGVFVGLGFGGWGPVAYPYPAPYVAYAPPPPPAIAYAPPAYPGPGYSWIAGYYYPVGARWAWRPGRRARGPARCG